MHNQQKLMTIPDLNRMQVKTCRARIGGGSSEGGVDGDDSTGCVSGPDLSREDRIGGRVAGSRGMAGFGHQGLPNHRDGG